MEKNSKVDKFTGIIRIDMTMTFYINSFFFVRLLVFEMYRILVITWKKKHFSSVFKRFFKLFFQSQKIPNFLIGDFAYTSFLLCDSKFVSYEWFCILQRLTVWLCEPDSDANQFRLGSSLLKKKTYANLIQTLTSSGKGPES